MATTAEGTGESAAPKKKRGLILAVGGVVLLAAGGGGGWFLLGKSGGPKEAAGPEASAHDTQKKPVDPRGVLSLEPFIVNLADADTDRYVKCTLRLVMESQASADVVKSHELAVTRVRDRILTLLSGKRFVEIATPEGKEALRGEIATAVGNVLEAGKVEAVYYTEFIVQ